MTEEINSTQDQSQGNCIKNKIVMTSPKLSNDMMELKSFLEARNLFVLFILIVKLGSRSKVYLKSLRDLDLELVAIIAMSPPPPPPPIKLF